jgi:glucose/arabinose dehydrogenase
MRYIVLLITCLAAAAIGCGGGGDAAGKTETAARQIPLQGSPAAKRVSLRQIGTFASPTYLTAPNGDRRRLFVLEQAGTIRVVRDGKTLATPFLDLRSDVSSGGERGLLGMAFAPDYAKSGLFYVHFTGLDGDIHIQEFRRATADRANRGSRRELLRVEHSAFSNHNGGQLSFGPDGHLYDGIGDGGSEGDPYRTAQNPKLLVGKILRFDAARKKAQIFALGLRNPWRFSFDRANGDMTIADVGQDKYEEVDFVKWRNAAGRNYGWSVFEGRHVYHGGPTPPNYVPPVLEHSHSEGWCSITGGYIVRDRSLTSLYGRYVYGDYCNPALWSAKLAPGRATGNRPIGLRVPALSSFGEDGRGRVYAVSLNGPVYRVSAR